MPGDFFFTSFLSAKIREKKDSAPFRLQALSWNKEHRPFRLHYAGVGGGAERRNPAGATMMRGRGGGRGGVRRGMRNMPYARPAFGGGASMCDNCFQPGHLASRCPMEPTCHACGSTAHGKRDCPNKNKSCDLCGKVGHLKFKCRSGGGAVGVNLMGSAGGSGAGSCWTCGGIGHRASECPGAGGFQGGAAGGEACWTCGGYGHRAAECTMGGGGGGGGKACDNCQQVGHLAAKCPNPAQCHCCGSTAHSKRDCTKLSSQCDLCGKVGHLKTKCRQTSF